MLAKRIPTPCLNKSVVQATKGVTDATAERLVWGTAITSQTTYGTSTALLSRLLVQSKTLPFLLFFILFVGLASAQNVYYVSTTGSDSNSGTGPDNAHAWRTITHADSALTLGVGGNNCPRIPSWVPNNVIGACVHVMPGTYTANMTTTRSGTATQRIVFISDTSYGAVLVPGGSDDHWNSTGSYVTIQDFEFNGSTSNSCCGIAQYPWVGQHNLWVIGNKMHDYASSCNNTGGAVIIMTNGTNLGGANSNNIIDGNLIYHNNCGASGSTPNPGGQHGIYVAAPGDIIRNNVVINQGGGFCITWWHQASNLDIETNTVLGCGYTGIGGGNDGSGIPAIDDFDTIDNNISVNNVTGSGYAIAQVGSHTGPHTVIQNNLQYGNLRGFQTFNGVTAAATQTGTNSSTFMSYTGDVTGDYRLKLGSNAIGNGTTTCAAGVTNCTPTTDADGNVRGAVPDLGAYQFAQSGSPSAPSGLTAVVQ